MYKKAIEAAIKDEEWLSQFQSDKVPAPPGSSLEVDLKETYITNDMGELIGDPTYEILKVHGVTQKPTQSRMDFRDESGD